MKYLTYDEECYPDVYTNTVKDRTNGEFYVFEVSMRVNDIDNMRQWIAYWASQNYSMIGFNNIGYDYPLLHAILTDMTIRDAADIYKVSANIIATPWENRFFNQIPVYKHVIRQIDLFKINHYDNVNKSTSLKFLEFVMRMYNIEELPFEPGKPVGAENIPKLLEYNKHDVVATDLFADDNMKAIAFRDSIGEKYGKDFTNHNDGKIGNDYFVMKLEEAGVKCFNGREPIQTIREYIDLGELILPYISFERQEFKDLVERLKTTRIYETKDALAISVVVDGFSFDFGLGGLHASVKGQKFVADDEYEIWDWDFASWYPHIAFVNGIYPEHLSSVFCDVYRDVYLQRKSYAKGTPENGAMKLALNTVYGNSNSEYSCFFDSKYTMKVTINGQLLLCMLSEHLMKIPDLTMIQCNTDGVTVKVPKKHVEHMKAVCKWMEDLTGIELEGAEYSMMAIRDVNNYLAVYTGSGEVKHKSAYNYNGKDTHRPDTSHFLEHHKDHGMQVVTKAACAAILHGENVRKFIMNHDDMFDFFKCVKTRKTDRLILKNNVMWGDQIVFDSREIRELQKITRYYVSKSGDKLVKQMPPVKRKTTNVNMVMLNWKSKKLSGGLNKNLKVTNENEYLSALKVGYTCKDGGTYTHSGIRESGVDKEYLVTECNRINENTAYDIDYGYYIAEAEKLVNAIL